MRIIINKGMKAGRLGKALTAAAIGGALVGCAASEREPVLVTPTGDNLTGGKPPAGDTAKVIDTFTRIPEPAPSLPSKESQKQVNQMDLNCPRPNERFKGSTTPVTQEDYQKAKTMGEAAASFVGSTYSSYELVCLPSKNGSISEMAYISPRNAEIYGWSGVPVLYDGGILTSLMEAQKFLAKDKGLLDRYFNEIRLAQTKPSIDEAVATRKVRVTLATGKDADIPVITVPSVDKKGPVIVAVFNKGTGMWETGADLSKYQSQLENIVVGGDQNIRAVLTNGMEDGLAVQVAALRTGKLVDNTIGSDGAKSLSIPVEGAFDQSGKEIWSNTPTSKSTPEPTPPLNLEPKYTPVPTPEKPKPEEILIMGKINIFTAPGKPLILGAGEKQMQAYFTRESKINTTGEVSTDGKFVRVKDSNNNLSWISKQEMEVFTCPKKNLKNLNLETDIPPELKAYIRPWEVAKTNPSSSNRKFSGDAERAVFVDAYVDSGDYDKDILTVTTAQMYGVKDGKYVVNYNGGEKMELPYCGALLGYYDNIGNWRIGTDVAKTEFSPGKYIRFYINSDTGRVTGIWWTEGLKKSQKEDNKWLVKFLPQDITLHDQEAKLAGRQPEGNTFEYDVKGLGKTAQNVKQARQYEQGRLKRG